MKTMRSIRLFIRFSLLLLALFLWEPAYSTGSGEKVVVVTSAAPITNIVQNVGGEYADVTGIIANGLGLDVPTMGHFLIANSRPLASHG